VDDAPTAEPAGRRVSGGDPSDGASRRRKKGASLDLIPLTAPEVRRLLLVLAVPVEQRRFQLHWSRWRRQRQAQARRSHYRRRAQAPSPGELPL